MCRQMVCKTVIIEERKGRRLYFTVASFEVVFVISRGQGCYYLSRKYKKKSSGLGGRQFVTRRLARACLYAHFNKEFGVKRWELVKT